MRPYRILKLLLSLSLLLLLIKWLSILLKDNQYINKQSGTNHEYKKLTSLPSKVASFHSVHNSLQVSKGSDLNHSFLNISTTISNKKRRQEGMCPEVFVIGVRKGGTTSLYHYLSSHPFFKGIRLDWGPVAGETWWFSQEYDIEKLPEYLQLFPSLRKGEKTGEATVDYFVNCQVPHRIVRACGSLKGKMIILLRNPIDRFISDYYMRLKIGRERYYPGQSFFNINLSLGQVIELEYKRFEDKLKNYSILVSSFKKDWRRFLCLFREGENLFYEGLYYVHLMNWLSVYPSDRILIVSSRSFFENTPQILGKILKFIDLPELSWSQLQTITSTVYNHGSYNRSLITSRDLKRLAELYEPFSIPLLQLLQWNAF